MPIEVTDLGVWRVEGSRVTVDSILHEFWRGSTPEQIQDEFPTVSLASIHTVISYCLRHPRKEEAKNPKVDAHRTKLRAIRDARATSSGTGA
jgi:uncharacterized protein (DUF433 family)